MESKCTKNKEVTTNKAEGDSTPNELPEVSTADRPSTIKVTSSDKLDNKQNNKPTKSDSDLAEIIETWPELPDAICSAIVAIVRASKEKLKG
ncbi:MAG: hypothetical protein RQ760_05065 [Sedimentisphaerales bacterium]|nr:hypothetical protein [Sedimentisphaerales bacterium]